MNEEFVIALRGVRFFARHGVMAQEKTVGNEFMVDLSVRVPVSDGARRDELEGTVSYADVYEVLSDVMNVPSATLEHVCLRIAAAIRNRFPGVRGGEVAVTKVAPPISGFSGSASVSYTF